MEDSDLQLLRRGFPAGAELPPRLIELFDATDDRIGVLLGDLMLQVVLWSETLDFFRGEEEPAARFAAFARDGRGSLYGFWLYEGRTLETAPIGYLNAEHLVDHTVLASSLDEFLALIAVGRERVGDIDGWDGQDEGEIGYVPEYRSLLTQKLGLAPAQDPRALVAAAKAAHPDLQAWVNEVTYARMQRAAQEAAQAAKPEPKARKPAKKPPRGR